MSILELELLLEGVQRKQQELQQTMNKLSEEIQKLIAILQEQPKAEQRQQASKSASAESLLNWRVIGQSFYSRYFKSIPAWVITTTNYIWVSNWPRFVCRYFGANLLRVFWTRHSSFLLAKAISLSSTTNWVGSHFLKAELSTLPSDKGSWTTSSLKLFRRLMVSDASHHYKAECWLNDFCALCLYRTHFHFHDVLCVRYPAQIVPDKPPPMLHWLCSIAHHPDGANATTQKLQNTKANGRGAGRQREDNLSNVSIRPAS